LIFEDHSGVAADIPEPGEKRRAGEILAACAAEACRHADALAAMDDAVGTALGRDRPLLDHKTLQALDLLRQEAAGLAHMLTLAVSAPSPDTVIEHDAIADCVPLAAQRARLTT
jgi:hypothetical protein